MEQLPEPKCIILDVWRDVRALENALKACGLIGRRDVIVASIIIAACDSDMCWANMLEVVAEIKHSQKDHLRERDLQRLAMAVGDLGMAVINQFQNLWLYDAGRILPYMFHGFVNGAILVKSNNGMRYLYRASLEDGCYPPTSSYRPSTR